MEFEQFNFESPVWLLGLLAIPAIWLLYAIFHHPNSSIRNLEKFADKELIPHLLKNSSFAKSNIYTPLFIWTLLWTASMLAMSGPRWDYTDIDTYAPDQSLVILLDLSQSMNASDVKPSRLKRANQEIEDMLKMNNDVKIGLVAFAADSHMISPITDDMETINNLLPSLSTDIVYIQGSKLSPALEMARQLLSFESGDNKSILVISDGGFEDGSAINVASEIAKKNITINAMGIGTKEGAPIPDNNGNLIKQNGNTYISKLDSDRLKAISDAGNGMYVEASYLDNDTQAILNQITEKTKAQEKTKHQTRYWEERFYIFVFPLMLLILLWFRRGYAFPVILLLIIFPAQKSQASDLQNMFKNDQQIGKQYIENKDYNSAAKTFKDPYKRGVAEYKAGNFAEAEKSFSEASRPEIELKSKYNLGNALAQQKKFEDAISAYEDVLKQQPDNKKAKENLEIVKKIMLQQQKQNNKDNKDSDKSDKEESSDDKNKQDDKSKDEKGSTEDKKSEQNKDEQEKQNSDKEQQDAKDMNEEQADEEQYKEEQSEAEKAEDSKDKNEQQQASKEQVKTQKDIDADQWLNKVTNDPKSFLKNQFYIESKRNGTMEENNPW